MKSGSPGACLACEIGSTIAGLVVLAAAFYVTFILHRSAWWIAAGVLIASFFSCKGACGVEEDDD